MLTVEQVREALKDRNITAVAKATGLHRNTLYAIASGDNKNPSYETMRVIVRYLEDSIPKGAS